ncbi:MAG: hypothetical protein IPO92_04525 [Saprospiraceae bacterium]|nr:hypothetical protein [Saprospiraceae bacterium]
MNNLFLILAFFISISINAQLNIPTELESTLKGKVKLSDIKRIVTDYYNVELNKLSPDQISKRKAIMKQLKKWNRQCWVSEYYTDNQGIVQDAYQINSVAIAKLNREKASSNNRFQPNNWNLQGPVTGDKGIGRIDRITFHPNNPNIMYAGSPHGGLFVSINGGISWDALAGFYLPWVFRV